MFGTNSGEKSSSCLENHPFLMLLMDLFFEAAKHLIDSLISSKKCQKNGELCLLHKARDQ